MLTGGELSRYARQLVLPEIGVAGQERLRAARVLIVGAGGLGSPAALYLAAAGIGTLGIIDGDAVELSNLHRQILHGTADIGRGKATSASERLSALNPHVAVERYEERLSNERALELIASFDVVVDGSDNYATRYAVNDACAALKKPWVYGSVERFAGQLSTFAAGGRPCYRCIFPEAPLPGATPSCEEIGVLGAIPGVVGALQATEALKLLLGIGEPLVGRLVQIDLLRGDWRMVSYETRPGCTTCDGVDRITRNPAPENAIARDLSPRELAAEVRRGATVQLLDVRESWEWNVARIEGARLVPLHQLEASVDTLDRAQEVVVYCHHGMRSAIAADWLRSLGYRARNLSGGIDGWSREVDDTVPRY